MIIHQWVARGKCACGYFWTTPGTQSIRCACGQGLIEDGVLLSGDAVTDEGAFEAAVAADLRVDPADLIVERVT